MYSNILKKFAVISRRELIQKVELQALKQGIKEKYDGNIDIISYPRKIMCNDQQNIQREIILKKISALNKSGEKGFQLVIDEIACFWFNRFIALRFMEINRYIPSTFTIKDSVCHSKYTINKINFFLDVKKIQNMRTNGDREGIFRHIIMSRCNDLNKVLPFIFEESGDYTELLFPQDLLSGNNFVFNLVNMIPKELWQDVEIIGWLYEYYISEEQNRIISLKKRYTKKQIPYVTQLFTPDWIVKYMVQNSLGRYWIENHPEHKYLKKGWEFYIENLECEREVESHIDKLLKITDIKCFDPACGSGNILVYVFRLLYGIYIEYGYIENEIPQIIINNNLYGLDIHDGACEIACFVISMESMKHDEYFIEKIKKKNIKFNIVSIKETNNFDNECIRYMLGDDYKIHCHIIENFIEQFKDAKMYGSLIKLKEFKEEFWTDLLNKLKCIRDSKESSSCRNIRKRVIKDLAELIRQSKIMLQIYDVLITNPPYINNKYLPPILSKYISQNYSEVKSDMFSVFMIYGFSKVKYNGQLAFMTPFVWMFIQSYEKLRKKIIECKTITSLIQLEYSGFQEATVPICTFTLRNYKVNIKGSYIKLSEFKGHKNQPIKVKEAIYNPFVNYRFTSDQNKMKSIPGNRFGYWLTNREIQILNEASVMEDVAFPCTGMQTGNNNKYIRYWFEVDYDLINFNERDNDKKYWMPYQMGGEARKWYGNISEVIYWKNNGEDVRKEKGSLIRNEKFFFKKGISWKRITSGNNTIRVLNEGFIFDQSADSIFVKNTEDYNYILAFLNTNIMISIFKFISPTLNLTAGTVKQIPVYIERNVQVKRKIYYLCEQCINICKTDWNFFEISWNFRKHPFVLINRKEIYIDKKFLSENCDLQPEYYISHVFIIWTLFTNNKFKKLKGYEEEINKIFINIYGLKNELTPEVCDKDITIRRADKKREVKSFISYAVGCMFGRYSVEKEGVIYDDKKKHTLYGLNGDFMGNSVDQCNIIPVFFENHFRNDIVCRFIKFVCNVFGRETLDENLDFIAETLGKKEGETNQDTLRRYFVNDFFKDHVQIYRGAPIYWLFTSGKFKVFNCLIYVHRYDKNILAIIKNCYVNKLQYKIYEDIQSMLFKMDKCCESKKKHMGKKLNEAYKQRDELIEYDKMLLNKINMNIEVDLNLGIKANYEKFLPLLKKL